MTDFAGNEILVNCKVVFLSNDKKPKFEKGEVIGFAGQYVIVSYIPNGLTGRYEIKKPPQSIVVFEK